jgi:prepilin-type N-terminal cleavage/methylation domain-containing protein
MVLPLPSPVKIDHRKSMVTASPKRGNRFSFSLGDNAGMRFPRRNSRIEPLNRAIGAPVSDPARFKMRDIEPGRRPALQFMGRAGFLSFSNIFRFIRLETATRLAIPVGGSPTGTGESPVPPNSETCHPSLRRASPAFTLIELMVVITIIGIMTALMIPEMKGSFQDALLRANSRELINAFDLAYSRAVSLNQVRRVRLDASTGRYLVERQVPGSEQESFVLADDVPGSKGQLDSRITVEFHSAGEDASDETASPESPVAGSESSPTAITFYPDGTADAGAVLLRDRVGFRLLLQINPVTARVHVVEMEREAQP